MMWCNFFLLLRKKEKLVLCLGYCLKHNITKYLLQELLTCKGGGDYDEGYDDDLRTGVGCWDIIKTQPGETSINNNRLGQFWR